LSAQGVKAGSGFNECLATSYGASNPYNPLIDYVNHDYTNDLTATTSKYKNVDILQVCCNNFQCSLLE